MKFTEETILEYLDGSLSSKQEEELQSILKTDKELASLFKHHQQIHGALEQESLRHPSAGFADRVMDSVNKLHTTRSRFFNRSRLFVIALVGIIIITTAYYLSAKFYPGIGGALRPELTLREISVDLNPARKFLDSDSLFKIVFYVNGVIGLLLLDRAVLKPYFARRRERYSM